MRLPKKPLRRAEEQSTPVVDGGWRRIVTDCLFPLAPAPSLVCCRCRCVLVLASPFIRNWRCGLGRREVPESKNGEYVQGQNEKKGRVKPSRPPRGQDHMNSASRPSCRTAQTPRQPPLNKEGPETRCPWQLERMRGA